MRVEDEKAALLKKLKREKNLQDSAALSFEGKKADLQLELEHAKKQLEATASAVSALQHEKGLVEKQLEQEKVETGKWKAEAHQASNSFASVFNAARTVELERHLERKFNKFVEVKKELVSLKLKVHRQDFVVVDDDEGVQPDDTVTEGSKNDEQIKKEDKTINATTNDKELPVIVEDDKQEKNETATESLSFSDDEYQEGVADPEEEEDAVDGSTTEEESFPNSDAPTSAVRPLPAAVTEPAQPVEEPPPSLGAAVKASPAAATARKSPPPIPPASLQQTSRACCTSTRPVCPSDVEQKNNRAVDDQESF